MWDLPSGLGANGNLQILMLNVIASPNHKHNCIRKRCFCPRHLLATTTNYALD